MKNLIALLEKQLQLLESLSLLLESELHLISSRDAEALTKVLNQKTQVLDEIAQQDSLVTNCFAKTDGAADDEDVNASFEKIRIALEQCKFRTEINQKAVEQGQLRLEHLRTLLLESRAKETMTYDKSGKTRGGTSGKGVSA